MITEFAAAKINLYLHVLGKRPDGFHELESLVVFADIGDQLRFESRAGDETELVIEGEYAAKLGDGEGNLVYRAAASAREMFGVEQGVHITLTKNLPVASGIGGGSADAAATLRGLARLWNKPIEDPRWMEIAQKLGSDVPVCLGSRRSIMQGRGEKLEAFKGKLPPYLVLVNPNRGLETRIVFERFHAGERSGAESAIAALHGSVNDLEDAAILIMPQIRAIVELIGKQKNCLLARMSGSGASCFGLFEDEKDAASAAQAIGALHPEWWVRAGKIIGDS